MTESVVDIESLKNFIIRRTKDTWREKSIPYYLSYVANDLKRIGVDYRKFVAPMKLSQWASSNEISGVRFVVHKQHKAKVGFVPADSGFDFDKENLEESPNQTEPLLTRGTALKNFVNALSLLPEELLENFAIPAKILVSLSRK